MLAVGALRIDRAALTVAVDGRRVELTPTEYKLLVMLAERRGQDLLAARARLVDRLRRIGAGVSAATKA